VQFFIYVQLFDRGHLVLRSTHPIHERLNQQRHPCRGLSDRPPCTSSNLRIPEDPTPVDGIHEWSEPSILYISLLQHLAQQCVHHQAHIIVHLNRSRCASLPLNSIPSIVPFNWHAIHANHPFLSSTHLNHPSITSTIPPFLPSR